MTDKIFDEETYIDTYWLLKANDAEYYIVARRTTEKGSSNLPWEMVASDEIFRDDFIESNYIKIKKLLEVEVYKYRKQWPGYTEWYNSDTVYEEKLIN